MKQCVKCKEQKLFSEFYKSSTAKDDLQGRCKKCMNIYAKKYSQTYNWAEHYRKYRKTLIGCLRTRFQQMKKRCTNPKYHGYNCYGGRGIQCKFESSDEFIDYVINELKIDPRGLTIDRIDNNGHYEPGNIRFVTQIENNKNRRRK